MGFSEKFCRNVGRKITYTDYYKRITLDGVMVSCSPGMYGSALIKIVFDEPVLNSMEKYGEMLYKQKQIRYGSEGELRDVVFEDLTEPQRRTEEDFFQKFLGQRVSFVINYRNGEQKTVNDVIVRVEPEGIHVKNSREIDYFGFFHYARIVNLPTVVAESPPVAVAPPTAVATPLEPVAEAEIIRSPTVEAKVVPEEKRVFLVRFLGEKVENVDPKNNENPKNKENNAKLGNKTIQNKTNR